MLKGPDLVSPVNANRSLSSNIRSVSPDNRAVLASTVPCTFLPDQNVMVTRRLYPDPASPNSSSPIFAISFARRACPWE